MLKVGVWGPGSMGVVALRGVIDHPQLELVDVVVHSDAKAGRDAGELCGIAPVGVVATQDPSAMLAGAGDVVVYAAGANLRPLEAVEDMVSILLAGPLTLGAGLLLSPLAVFFSDVVELVTVLLTLLLYLTPIFYPMSIVPDQYRWLVRFNPIRSILEVFRDPIYFGKIPPPQHLAVCVGVALIALLIGSLAFRRSSDRIPFYI